MPDYTKYSLDELYEALNTIDQDLYSERALIIQREIERRRDKKTRPKKSKPQTYESVNVIDSLEKQINILRVITFTFGLSTFINYFWRLGIGLPGYTFTFSLPGFNSLDKAYILFTLNAMVIAINSLFMISPIIMFFEERLSVRLLVISWGLMALGFEFWLFMWWPTLSFDVPIGIKFTVFSVPIGFRVNLVSAFCLFWASIGIPEYRKLFT